MVCDAHGEVMARLEGRMGQIESRLDRLEDLTEKIDSTTTSLNLGMVRIETLLAAQAKADEKRDQERSRWAGMAMTLARILLPAILGAGGALGAYHASQPTAASSAEIKE